MNENQAEELSKEFFKRFEHVESYSEDTVNFEVRISGRVKAVSPIPSCDLCRNRIICIVNRELAKIAPVMATATLSMKISHDINRLIAKECKRFER